METMQDHKPVAWMTVETDGKIRTTHKEATADMWRCIAGSTVSPLYASPVQPVLEWVGEEYGDRYLNLNGKQIGNISNIGNGEYRVRFMGGEPSEPLPIATAMSTLMTTARQWLSGGGK